MYKKGEIKMYNLKEYIKSVKLFVEETKEWGELDNYKHYVAVENGWLESEDNHEGGLSLSWAFKKDISDDVIKEHFIKEVNIVLDTLIFGNGIENLEINIVNKE